MLWRNNYDNVRECSLIDENGNNISLIPPSRKYTYKVWKLDSSTCTSRHHWEITERKKERTPGNLTVMASQISHGYVSWVCVFPASYSIHLFRKYILHTHTQDLKKKCFLDTEDPTLYTHLHSYSYKPSIYTEFSSDSWLYNLACTVTSHLYSCICHYTWNFSRGTFLADANDWAF